MPIPDQTGIPLAKNYSTFELNDFVQDRFFCNGVINPTVESSQFWAQWLHEHPDKKPVIEQARQLVLAINSMDHVPIAGAEVQAQIQTILAKADAAGYRRRYGWLLPTAGWVAAAAVCLAAGAGWWLLNRPTTVSIATVAPVIVQRNTTDKPRLINLPDGSTLLLSTNSSVRYARSFARHERSVSLTGTAFFEVKKNPAQPFVVYADKLVARVLGTSFTIRQDAGHRTIVAVRTGRVQVYRPARKGSLTATDQPTAVLVPNQQLVYAPASANVPVVNAPAQSIGSVTTSFPETQFTFRNTPVTTVFHRLETAYTLRINFDRVALRQCTITAVMTDEPLGTKLDLICKSLGLTYVLTGDTATVTGAGCQAN